MSIKNNKCPHLDNVLQLSLSDLCKLKQGVPCSECKAIGPNLWICLYKNCLHTGCSEQYNDHSTKHFQNQSSHCVHMNLSSQRIWCYLCESEVFLLSNQSQRRNSLISNESSDNNNISKYSSEKVMIYDRGGGESCESSCDEDEGNRCNIGGLVGLQNIANTCYMNAALQALSNSPPLTGYFLDCDAIIEASGELIQNQRFGLAKNYHKLIKEMWSKNRRGYVVPSGILACIRNVHPMFRGFQQHDTQEFLRCFMDQLHDELKEVIPPPPEILFNNNNSIEHEDSSSCNSSSPSQSEAEYETCDSGVSEQSSLSDEGFGSHRREYRTNNRSSSPTPPSNVSANQRNLTKSHNLDSNFNSTKSLKEHPNNKLPSRSIISEVFDGKLLSSVQCLTCDRVSTREETFQDLSLPIPGKDHLAVIHQNHGTNIQSSQQQQQQQQTPSGVTCTDAVYQASQDGWFWWFWNWFRSWLWGPAVSLHDCMAAFFSADELKGDNMYSCEKCNKLRNGIKFSRVLALPEMLCVHLKRFRHDLSYSSKISSPVHFPLTGLDMRPYLHKDCKSEISTYDLTAVICHHGTVGGGHYTSFAKHEHTRKWFEYDDQLVTEVTPDVVENCEAYVLFYRKTNPQMVLLRTEALRLIDSTPQQASDMEFFVSRQWLNRFNTFAEPGPIDNWTLLCPHGDLPPHKAAMFSRLVYPLPQPLWDFLYNKFGGGPACNHYFECAICRRAAETLSSRQTAELKAFAMHNESHENSTTIYAISMAWFRQWQLFARGITTEEPGPINNKGIAGQSDSIPLRSVRPGSDYAQLNTTVWKFFYDLYGGGPEIILRGGPTEDKPIKMTREIEQTTEPEENSIDTRKNSLIPKQHHQVKSIHTILPTVPVSNEIKIPNSTIPLQTTIQSNAVTNYNPAFTCKATKSVSFEIEDVENSSNDQSQDARVQPKRSKKEIVASSTTTIISPINKKEKKYRMPKSGSLFGPEGKYSEYQSMSLDEQPHSNSLEKDSVKKIDEIMPLLHQTSISSNNQDEAITAGNTTTFKNVQQSHYKREKEKGNGRNSNRKKIKSKSLRNKFIANNVALHNNDSDSN